MFNDTERPTIQEQTLPLEISMAQTDFVRKIKKTTVGGVDSWTSANIEFSDFEGQVVETATEAAKGYADAAKVSEDNAKISEDNAAQSETNAATSESNAFTSAANALTSEQNTATSEQNASTSEQNAATSEENALSYKNTAESAASTATTKAGEASQSAADALASSTAYDVYNVTNGVPIAPSFYTLTTAVASIPIGVKKKGIIITFETSSGVWETWKYTANSLTGWSTLSNWSASAVPYMLQPFQVLRNGAAVAILNNTAQTLSFPIGQSYLFYIGGKEYENAIPDTGLTIPLDYSGSSAKVIVWEVATKTFSIVAYTAVKSLQWTHIVFATYRIASSKAYISFAADVPYTISDGFDTPPMQQSLKIIRNGRYYPIIDTLYKTLTFPASNYNYVFLIGGKYYVDAIPSSGTTITLDTTGTSAKAIVWDIANKVFSVVAYNSAATYALTHVVFATYRYDVDGKFHFSMPDIPYIMDDKLLGIVESPTEMKTNAFVRAINHRGYNPVAPENTMSAFKLSRRKGFRYVECDVRWTSDNVPVLLHDATINRTSNGTGNIIDMTYATARTYDFGTWKNAVYANERIPSFDEFILFCKRQNVTPYLHINTAVTDPQMTILWNIVVKYGMKRHVVWLSYDSATISKVLAIDSAARVAIFVDTLTEAAITSTAALKTATNDVFISADASTISLALCAFAIAAGIYVEAWGVLNAASAVTLTGYGVDGLTVDDFNVQDALYA